MANDVSPIVLNSLRPPRIRNAADWANKEAYLPPSDSHSGKFRCRPYQAEILKAMSIGSRMKASGSAIKEVILCKSAQCGYTISLLHAITYTVIHRPTNIGIYFPNNDATIAFASNQAAKYFDAQPSLQGLISSEVSSDGKSSAVRKHFPNGTLRFLAANKPSDVATHSFGYVLIDEYDLVSDVRGEGSAYELIKNRTQEFHDAVIVVGGTPRGSFLDSNTWDLYNNSDKRRYMIKCPKCGKPQYLSIKQFEIGQSDYNDSGFRCIADDCDYLMREHEKPKLVKNGYWKVTGDSGVPGRAGFHISSLYADSPNCSWPNLARQREDAGYDKEKLKVFINTRLGLPVSPTDFGKLKADDILDQIHSSNYATVFEPSQLPNEVSLITIGCDVQGPGKDARLEFSIYGWSRNQCYFLNHYNIPGNPLEEEVWDTFRETALINYSTIDKKKSLQPAIVFVDSGNGQHTLQVYRQCAKVPRVMFPIKGNATPGKALVVQGQAPGRAQPLFHIQTVAAKDLIMGMLKRYTAADPEAEIHFPNDLDPMVAAGLTSEYRQTKPGNPPKVVYVHNRVNPNEPLDCFVYALAAKEQYVGAYDQNLIWPALEKRASTTTKPKPKRVKPKKQSYGGWY